MWRDSNRNWLFDDCLTLRATYCSLSLLTLPLAAVNHTVVSSWFTAGILQLVSDITQNVYTHWTHMDCKGDTLLFRLSSQRFTGLFSEFSALCTVWPKILKGIASHDFRIWWNINILTQMSSDSNTTFNVTMDTSPSSLETVLVFLLYYTNSGQCRSSSISFCPRLLLHRLNASITM